MKTLRYIDLGRPNLIELKEKKKDIDFSYPLHALNKSTLIKMKSFE